MEKKIYIVISIESPISKRNTTRSTIKLLDDMKNLIQRIFGKRTNGNSDTLSDKEEVRRQVFKIVEDMYSLKPSQVKDNASLQGVLKINNLAKAILMMKLENVFHIKINDQEMSEIKTVSDVVETVYSKINENKKIGYVDPIAEEEEAIMEELSDDPEPESEPDTMPDIIDADITRDEIRQRVFKIMKDVAGNPDLEVTEESSLEDDLHVDSLGLMTIILALEEEFDIDIKEEDLQRMQSISDLIDYLYAYV